IPHVAALPEEGVRLQTASRTRLICLRLPNHRTVIIDRVRLTRHASKRAQIAQLTPAPQRGVRSEASVWERKNGLPGHVARSVDRIAGAGRTAAQVLHDAVEPEEGVLLAVGCPGNAGHLSGVVDPSGTAGITDESAT